MIHCDLKPENLMIEKFDKLDMTLIDFGSACFEGETLFTYIQSRFYRAPEVSCFPEVTLSPMIILQTSSRQSFEHCLELATLKGIDLCQSCWLPAAMWMESKVLPLFLKSEGSMGVYHLIHFEILHSVYTMTSINC